MNDLMQFRSKPLTIVHGFRPESENFDFDKKGCHQQEHLNMTLMAQISALYIAPSRVFGKFVKGALIFHSLIL